MPGIGQNICNLSKVITFSNRSEIIYFAFKEVSTSRVFLYAASLNLVSTLLSIFIDYLRDDYPFFFGIRNYSTYI